MNKRLLALLLSVVTVATSINVTGIQAKAAEDNESAYVEMVDAESEENGEIVLEEVSAEEAGALDEVIDATTSEEAAEEDTATEEAVEDANTEEVVEEDATTEEAVEEDAATEEVVEEVVEEDATAEEVEEEDAVIEDIAEDEFAEAEFTDDEEDASAEVALEEEVFEEDAFVIDEEVEVFDANTAMSTATALSKGTALSGTFTNSSTHYWYKFTTSSECMYYTVSFTTSAAYGRFRVQDKDGVNADGVSYVSGSQNGTVTYNFKLDPKTTYYIEVYENYHNSNTTPTFSVKYTSTTDVADTQATAKKVSYGTQYKDTLCTASDIDYYMITTGSDCAYYTLTATASSSYVRFQVLDSDGVNMLGGSSYMAPGANSRSELRMKLDSDSKYYIMAYSYYGTDVKSYSITLTKTADVADSYNTAASVVAGTKYTENLCVSADQDWYKFIGGAGKYTFTVNNVGANYFRYSLLDSNGNVKFTLSPGSSSVATKEIQLAAGTYYIKVYSSYSYTSGTAGGYNFKFTTTAGQNGLIRQADGNYYYFVNGVVATTYSGMVQSGSDWYYVTNGVLKWGVTGLTKYNGTWYYINNSKWDTSYSGLCKWNGTWYYITKGVLKWGVNGVTCYSGKYYYVNNSQVTFKDTGIAAYNGAYYYFNNSRFDSSYTGLAQYGNDWYYVTNGVLKWGVNTCAKYKNKWYYVSNSKVDFSYNGYVTWNGKRYRVKNGVVQA